MPGLHLRATFLALVLLTVAACGGSPTASLTSLGGPSGVRTVTTSAGASITGTLVGDAVAASSFLAADAGRPAVATDGPVTVSLAGTSRSQQVAPDGTFVFEGVEPGTIELHFSGAGIDARAILTIEFDEDIRIEVRVSGPAANVRVTDRRRKPKVEIEGVITALDEIGQTLTINGQTVGVSETTVIRHGNRRYAFLDLGIGDRVHARGTSDPDTGIVMAHEIKLQSENRGRGNSDDDEGEEDEDDGDDDHGRRPPRVGSVELEGPLGGLTGACPVLTFEVEGMVVTTDAATSFDDGTCADLTDGVSVEVHGSMTDDGAVLAARVENKSSDEDDGDDDGDDDGRRGPRRRIELDGRIGGLAGVCPTVTFEVDGVLVTTDTATSFRHGACADLADGILVEIRGETADDGSVVASRVEIESR